WAGFPEDDTDIELHLRGLCWESQGKPRTLIYNRKVPFLRNNVDLSLLNCSADSLSRDTLRDPAAYVALGELKGGIDPAGADEHWKTARTALSRIHEAFAKHKLKPLTFFIGAAIEAKMALEIWGLLQRGILRNAANLTNEDHIASITRWLCSL
ncbi:MAG TPA: AvaI/BsoBI family type II restriction endonuclease, partial [Terriglobia bacterium]|nr:AvaI/BsoBI family type II restriction endonuclease [Terriglobia bacterium]